MKYYAVIDTNVVVSAMLKWDSIPGRIIELAFTGMIIPVLNDAIIQEYRTVLSRPKFHLPPETVDAIIETFQNTGLFVDADKLDIELPDPKDRVFFDVVMEQRKVSDAYLITGNIKHYPIKPFVVTPRQMLDILLYSTED